MSEHETTTGTSTYEVPRDVRGILLWHDLDYKERDPFIVACPAWCKDGHRGWDPYDDRTHFGQEADIALELESGEYDRDSRTRFTETLRTYLQQHYREAEPRVFLGRGERAGVYMTLAEAALLRDRLSALIDQA